MGPPLLLSPRREEQRAAAVWTQGCRLLAQHTSTTPNQTAAHRSRHVAGMQLQIDCSRYQFQVKPSLGASQLLEKEKGLETAWRRVSVWRCSL
jgi:hypothetical protein